MSFWVCAFRPSNMQHHHRFSGNITKRGKTAKKEKEDPMKVSSMVLIVLFFVIVGNFFMQFLQTLNSQGGQMED